MGCCVCTSDKNKDPIAQKQVEDALQKKEKLPIGQQDEQPALNQDKEGQKVDQFVSQNQGGRESQLTQQKNMKRKNRNDQSDSDLSMEESDEEHTHQKISVHPIPCRNFTNKYSYPITIHSISVIKNPNSELYKILINVKYMGNSHQVSFDGIQSKHLNKSILNIDADQFRSKSQTTNIKGFFQEDRYFNAVPKEKNNKSQTSLSIFPYLIEVGRSQEVQHPSSSGFHKTQNNKPNIQREEEILEVMMIYDIIYQQNFKNLLMSKIIQNEFPKLKELQIQIKQMLIIFDSQPTFDIPNLNHLCIFYQKVDYSLNILRHFCTIENFNMQEDFVLHIITSLLTGLIQFYKSNFYGLNINLDSVIYCRKDNSFKFNSFNRIKNLLSLKRLEKAKVHQNTHNKKQFLEAFIKDQAAIMNITLYYIVLRMKMTVTYKELVNYTIAKKSELVMDLRIKTESIRQFSNLVLQSHLNSYDDVISHIQQKLSPILQDLENNSNAMDKNEFAYNAEFKGKSMINQIQQSFDNSEEIVQPNVPEEILQQDNLTPLSDSSNSNLSQEEAVEVSQIMLGNQNNQQLPTLNINFYDSVNKYDVCYGSCPEVLTELQKEYQQMYFNNLLMKQQLTQGYIFKQLQSLIKKLKTINKLDVKNEIIASQLYFSLYYKLLNIDSETEEDRLKRQKIVKQMMGVLRKVSYKSQEPLFIAAVANALQVLMSQIHLIQDILCHKAQIMSTDQMGNEKNERELLELMIKKFRNANRYQNKVKKDHMIEMKSKSNKKLKGEDKPNGLIQVRKIVIFRIVQAEFLIRESKLPKASSCIQNLINIQNKNKLGDSAIMGYTTYLHGIIALEENLFTSALLNFNVALGIYQSQFNPEYYRFGDLLYHLGIVNMELCQYVHSSEQFDECYQLRKQYYSCLDSEIIQVLIQMIKLYVLMDNVSDALQICYNYEKLTRNVLILKQSREPQTGMMICKLMVYLGIIFYVTGANLSAIKCYRRAIIVLRQSKIDPGGLINSLIFHNLQKTLQLIKNIARKSAGLVGLKYSDQFTQYGFLQLKDKVRVVLDSLPQSIYENQPSCSHIPQQIPLANHQLQLKDKISVERFKSILEELKKKKITQVFGKIQMHIAETLIKEQNYKNAITLIKSAIYQFSIKLTSPMKERLTLRCICMLITIYIRMEKRLEFQEQFDKGFKVIEEFKRVYLWDQSLKLCQHTRKPNKFMMLLRQGGIKIGVQILDLYKFIEEFQKFQSEISENIDDNKQMQKIVDKYGSKILALDMTPEINETIKKLRQTMGLSVVDQFEVRPPQIRFTISGQVLKAVYQDEDQVQIQPNPRQSTVPNLLISAVHPYGSAVRPNGSAVLPNQSFVLPNQSFVPNRIKSIYPAVQQFQLK